MLKPQKIQSSKGGRELSDEELEIYHDWLNVPINGVTGQIIGDILMHPPIVPHPKSKNYLPFLKKGLNYGKPIKDQKFKRFAVMTDEQLKTLTNYRQGIPINEEDKLVLCEIIEEEHRRLREGVWIWIKGKMYHVVGAYYLYIQYWTMKDGREPQFRESDMEFFQFMEYCVHDPLCRGMAMYGRRQSGKSSSIMCFIYAYSIRIRSGQFGLQSKTDTDAIKLLQECLVKGWANCPIWFKPTYRGDIKATRQLYHASPAERNNKKAIQAGKAIQPEPELDTLIFAANSSEKALDSGTFTITGQDEFGKTRLVNILERLLVVLQSSSKVFMMTTVEEMGAGDSLVQCTSLYNDSDPAERTANGNTKSLLYRYFIPAYKCYEKINEPCFIDEWGFSMDKEADEYILNERAAAIDNPSKLLSLTRKNPRTIEEALMPSNRDGLIKNIHLLIQREAKLREELKIRKDKYYIGNFEWINANESDRVNLEGYRAGIPKQGTTVVFRPTPNGRFKILADYFPTPEEQNNVTYYGSWQDRQLNYSRPPHEFHPNNKHFIAAIDGIKSTPVKTMKTASNGSLAIYRVQKQDSYGRPIEEDKDNANRFICIYLSRPVESIFADDMAKCLYFFGCEAVVENVDGHTEHGLVNLGMLPFIAHQIDTTDKTKPNIQDVLSRGQRTTKYEHDAMAKEIEGHIEHHVSKIEFEEIIKQWKSLTPENYTKMDLAISTGYCLIKANRPTFKEKYDANKTSLASLGAWLKR